jgi:murein DD-endopeptidase MepM/ murein hydrolase activator NlpD
MSAPVLSLQPGNADAMVRVMRLPAPARPQTVAGAPERVADLGERIAVSLPVPLQPPLHKPAADAAAQFERVVEVRRGDTFLSMLRQAGLSPAEAREAVDALRPLFSPQDLRSGQEVRLLFEPSVGEPAPRLSRVRFDATVEEEIRLTRDRAGDFAATSIDKPLKTTLARAKAPIRTNLFQTSKKTGVPYPVLQQVIQVLSFDVDLQRELQPGDSFEVIYERVEDESGDLAKPGELLFVSLGLTDRTLTFYRFATSDGAVDFYDRRGESIRKALLRTPIDGARITSGFGMREHPILGFSKMHKGVDFGAPKGTAIFAAGDGVVTEAGRQGAYGNYIRIRHNGRYETAYAHASRFAKGLSVGDRVRQGDIIAFVGSTGRSTGPHLHYEVLADGVQVNPQSIKLVGSKLSGKDLRRFFATVAEIDRLRDGPPVHVLVASRP